MDNTVTIKDVAALAGVSVGTTSRVLSGNPSTSPAARERVHAAVAELGYRPDARARSLRSARSHTVGLLISDVRNPFFADVAHGAEQAALRSSYVTLLANANEDPRQQDTYLESFLTQRVDGIIIAPQGADSAHLRTLATTVPSSSSTGPSTGSRCPASPPTTRWASTRPSPISPTAATPASATSAAPGPSPPAARDTTPSCARSPGTVSTATRS